MIKKIVLGTAVALGLGTFVFGRDFLSYARTWGSSVRRAVKSEVPLEFEIERANEMVQNLVPDIRECMHLIAEQQVEVEELSQQIAERERNLAFQKEALLALRRKLDSSRTSFVFAGHSYTRHEVRCDLAKRFERYRIAEETLKREKQILRAREQALQANQEKLRNMLMAKKDLEVQLEQLEARLKAVQAAETVATLDLDDTRLARAKKLIRELNKQLDVREKMLDAEGQFAGLIPVESEDAASNHNIGEQIDRYFQTDKDRADDDEVLSAAQD